MYMYSCTYVRVVCHGDGECGSETKEEEPLAAARTEEARGEGGKVEVGQSQWRQNREER